MNVPRVQPGHWFVAPAILVIGVFFLLPSLAAIAVSATDFDIYGLADSRNVRLVGIDNYRHLFANPLFYQALRNTLTFVLVAAPLSLLTSLSAALLVTSRHTWLPGLWRTVFFLPVVTTLVPVAIVWRYLGHAEYGLLNQILGVVGLGPIEWLGNGWWAMVLIILLATWKNFGFNMVILAAGLTSIPQSLYEAARLDGANSCHSFRSITLPMLAPTLLFATVTTCTGYLQLFAEPYVMTQGGPLHATYSMIMMMHEEGFRWWNIGVACSVAVVLFGIILIVTALQFWLYRGAQK